MENFLLDGTIRSYNKTNETNTTQATQSTQSTQAVQPQSSGLFSIGGMVLYFAIIIAIFYFMAIRPQKKRDKQLKALQDEIKLGDWVLLDSGIYGKVAGVSEGLYTIEFGTNKGVLIPVLKSRIIAKGEPNFSQPEDTKLQ